MLWRLDGMLLVVPEAHEHTNNNNSYNQNIYIPFSAGDEYWPLLFQEEEVNDKNDVPLRYSCQNLHVEDMSIYRVTISVS